MLEVIVNNQIVLVGALVDGVKEVTEIEEKESFRKLTKKAAFNLFEPEVYTLLRSLKAL